MLVNPHYFRVGDLVEFGMPRTTGILIEPLGDTLYYAVGGDGKIYLLNVSDMVKLDGNFKEFLLTLDDILQRNTAKTSAAPPMA
jgi:hypothetical protein